ARPDAEGVSDRREGSGAHVLQEVRTRAGGHNGLVPPAVDDGAAIAGPRDVRNLAESFCNGKRPARTRVRVDEDDRPPGADVDLAADRGDPVSLGRPSRGAEIERVAGVE